MLQSGSRDNNFNLIRMAAASAVIISHSYPLTMGHSAVEPLYPLMHPFTLGAAAVQVFFAISGFLVAQSLHNRGFAAFALLRGGRIMPGLFVVVALTTILMRFVSFANNPWSDVNGSLWTLRYEAFCYLALAVWSRSRLGCVALVAVALATTDAQWRPYYFELGLPFILGTVLWRYRLPLNGWAAFAFTVAAVVFRVQFLWSIALGYGALWLAFAPVGLRSYNRLGDYSYGTYIFGWPVQQLFVLMLPGIGPLELMSLALPAAWALGILSWHLVEKPSLAAVRSFIEERALAARASANSGGRFRISSRVSGSR